MKRTLLVLFTLTLLQTGKAQIDPVLATQLQDQLNARISQGNHGVAAWLIMPDGQTWSGTAGVNHNNVPITDSTVFHGASTTKLNIAVLMLLLAEKGFLDLDDSWHKYVSLNVTFDTLITIRQLLNHTSGIADYLETPATPTNVTTNFNYSYTPKQILENIVSQVPDFPAGTKFNYSSSNYVLAALVAEAVTGNPVQTELRTRIWNPLGMRHTYFGATETYTESTAGVWWNFSSGVSNYSAMSATSMLSYGYGGANIVSCPQDLAILLDALLTKQLLSSQSLSEMLGFVPASSGSWTKGYGLGIHHYGQAKDSVIGHDGYYTNLTDMFHSRKYGFTLVTMTNTETSWFGVFTPMYNTIVNHFKGVGIDELENEMELAIYPNPGSGQFTIRSSQPVDEISIKDVLGRFVYTAKPDGRSFTLLLEDEGMYFVTTRSGDHITTHKIMVQR